MKVKTGIFVVDHWTAIWIVLTTLALSDFLVAIVLAIIQSVTR